MARYGTECCTWHCKRSRRKIWRPQTDRALVQPDLILWPWRSKGFWVCKKRYSIEYLLWYKFNWLVKNSTKWHVIDSTGNQCSQGIGYYTQLVWQDTTHVGCGWSQFRYRGFPNYFENFLVCNYGPSANIWQQPVYDIANSTCNCQCLECNEDTGLCPPRCKCNFL